jgi:hypothetical protein
MKKLFTLIVLVSFSFGAAVAQSKTETSKSTKVVDKTKLQRVETTKQTSLSKKAENSTSNAVRTSNVLTQQQFDARREELLKNPKKSTKPAAKKD